MSRFRRNRLLDEEIRSSPRFLAERHAAAERVKRAATMAAPKGKTGGYARRFTVEVDGNDVAVGNTDFAAHLVEFGSANNPPYAPLRRGVRAAGLRLEENT